MTDAQRKQAFQEMLDGLFKWPEGIRPEVIGCTDRRAIIWYGANGGNIPAILDALSDLGWEMVAMTSTSCIILRKVT